MSLAKLELVLDELPRQLADIAKRLTFLDQRMAAIDLRLPAPLVTVKQAAAALALSESTIRRLVKSGELPHIKLGGAVRIDLSRIVATDAGDIQQIATMIRAAVVG